MSYPGFVRADARNGLSIVAKLTLLAFLTTVTLAGFHYAQFPGILQVKLPAPIANFFARHAISTSAPETSNVFDRESAMSSSELLDRWAPMIQEASARFHVPAEWIRAVIRQESGGRTVLQGDAPITSAAGAEGLMQLMPGTYAEMSTQYNLGENAFDPHDNIIAGAAYLRWLYKKYGFPQMFAAYNDGPGNFEDHLAGTHTLPPETRAYLANISARLKHHGLEASHHHGLQYADLRSSEG